MKHKERLDVLLVSLGLAESRAKAQATIMAGEVYVNGQKADKSGMEVDITSNVEVRGSACPYVSRGGLKLEKALRNFGVDPTGYVCSDSGASTGGFTDCLLQQGASKVFAIDVGYGQLAWKIRNDPRCCYGADEHPLCDAGGLRREAGPVCHRRVVYLAFAGPSGGQNAVKANGTGSVPD